MAHRHEPRSRPDARVWAAVSIGAGTVRFTASLRKPFAGAAEIAGITKQILGEGDAPRVPEITHAADVSSVVKRSVSRHATEAMEGW
ncbi:MAG TPA: hypothetical protein VJR89_03445 [Polyangiales bacterium]|nr:hypothetical protein [Polyangiales bacterium]